MNKQMPVMVEVNSGREAQKGGVLPEEVTRVLREIRHFQNMKICGLMTMGPYVDRPENIRPFYRETSQLFAKIKSLNIPGIEMDFLSMGMSDTFKIAIEEGANMVRLGNYIFGKAGKDIDGLHYLH